MMCADGEAAHDQTQLRDQVALHMPQGKQFFFFSMFAIYPMIAA